MSLILAILSALARLLGPVLPFLATWVAAKRDAAQAARNERLEADRKADRRMDNAQVSRGDSDADAQWLRNRSERR